MDPIEQRIVALQSLLAEKRAALEARRERWAREEAARRLEMAREETAIAGLAEELRDMLARRESAVQEREERFRLVHERVEEAAAKAKGRINLDVGGRIFSFTTETLAKYPESFFGRLVSGRWEAGGGKGKKKRAADEIETVFVERPQVPFQHIASFLITDTLNVELSESERDALLMECDYFGLDELGNLIKPQKKQKQVGWNFVPCAGYEDCLKQDGNSYTAHDVLLDLWRTEEWESGMHRWTIRVDNGKDVCIGIGDGTEGGSWEGQCEFETGDTVYVSFDADSRKMEIRWNTSSGDEGSEKWTDLAPDLKYASCLLDPRDQITLLETD